MSSESPQARLEIRAQPAFVDAALAFIETFALRCHIQGHRGEALLRACRVALDLVTLRNKGLHAPGTIEVGLSVDAGRLVVSILNRGVPLVDTQWEGFAGLHEAFRTLDRSRVENLGRDGQRLILQQKLGTAADGVVEDGARSRVELDVPDDQVRIRPLEPGEEIKLSKLFYFVYGYDYINEEVYYPDKLRQRIEDGSLISTVAALDDGRILGHVGLVRWNTAPPVYEAALGLVDPAVKSRGLFGRIFEKTMETVSRTPMQYCFFDFVTNHVYSQKQISRYGTRDLAVFVGCQRASTQARLETLGIGVDPQSSDRYSLLYSILPCVERPFGSTVKLPAHIGEPLSFLLEPLGLTWTPTSRFEQLDPAGGVEVEYHAEQDSVIFDLFEPGRTAADQIVRDWQRLQESGYRYAAIEVPLEAPGLGPLYEMLSASGFFAAGFVPYEHSDRLGFRFQSIGPAKVSFDEIQVASPTGKQLLEFVRSEYLRTLT